METDKQLSGDKSSNLTNLVSGIIISAAAVLPLAGCDMYTSYSTYPSYSPPPRVYIAPPSRYCPPQRYYVPPQRHFNNGPYGNHQRGPRGGHGYR